MDTEVKTPGAAPDTGPGWRRQTTRRRAALGAALIGAAALGAGATALALQSRHVTFVALSPVPIDTLRDGADVAVKGQVAEIFGNKFVLADGSGRALIDTGRRGEGSPLVSPSETVTVQGRFEHGFIHAAAIQRGDGGAVMLDPPPPPRPPLG